jgi:hypothetical protein
MEATTVADARGRRIVFSELNVLDQARLALVVGRGGHPEDTQNAVFMQMATVAYAVTEIDGVPMSRPATHAQIMAAIGALGDEGFAAVMLAMRADMDAVMDGADEAARRAAERSVAKNSPATPTS